MIIFVKELSIMNGFYNLITFKRHHEKFMNDYEFQFLYFQLCGTTMNGTTAWTYIVVQENLPILTHTTRR